MIKIYITNLFEIRVVCLLVRGFPNGPCIYLID